jgi:hypothetical protein
MNEMNPQQQNMVRTVRFVHRFLLLMVPLYAFVAERLRSSGMPDRPLDRTFLLIIGASAVSQALVAAFIRQKMVLGSEGVLRQQPAEAAVLKRWLSGNVTVFVLCESIALHGFVLRFLGAPFATCVLFYVLAIFLFLLWRPRWEPVGMR